MFMALQVTKSCNPLETARNVFATKLSQKERFHRVEFWEPDPGAFVIVRTTKPERLPFRAHVLAVHIFMSANEDTSGLDDVLMFRCLRYLSHKPNENPNVIISCTVHSNELD